MNSQRIDPEYSTLGKELTEMTTRSTEIDSIALFSISAGHNLLRFTLVGRTETPPKKQATLKIPRRKGTSNAGQKGQTDV